MKQMQTKAKNKRIVQIEVNPPEVYYATTACQSKTKVSTVVCAVVVPCELSPFKQQHYSLRLARKLHPDRGIVGVVKRDKLSTSMQIAVLKSRPKHIWKLEEME